MKAATSINDLSHGEIRAWLESALHGHESLPLATPDESPYLGVVRWQKELKPPTRESLWDACRGLIADFCAEGHGEPAFLEQLLGLASTFRDPETVAMLADLASRFPNLPQLPPEIQLAVLATLVDTPPPQPPLFWAEILKQDPQRYAALALSGVLATNPAQAIQMLPAMPDTERSGQAATLKLELAWDTLTQDKRFQFVQAVGQVLCRCGRHFAGFVGAWVRAKQSSRPVNTYPGLAAALANTLGGENTPKVFCSRLCPSLELVPA
jgi:hypothetical protein